MTVFQLMNRTVYKMHDLQMAKSPYILNPSQNMKKDLSLFTFWTPQLNSSICLWSYFNIYNGSMKNDIQADFEKSFPNLKTI